MHLQKEELAVVILLLFAAVASSALLLVAAGAPGTAYSSDSRPGEIVYLEGLLLHKKNTGSGGHLLLTVKSGTEMVTVFVSAKCDGYEAADRASPGNIICVQGKVQEYKGQREIAATSISIA